MDKLRTQIFVFFVFAGLLAMIAKAPEWYDSLPRFEQPPRDADAFAGMQPVPVPIDTINKYIEQKANYRKGSLTKRYEYWDTLHAYNAYGAYETDSLSILYYKAAYSGHEEIKAVLNPFVARYPSTLILYWQTLGKYSSIRFNYEDGIFTVITQVQPGDLIWETEATYSIHLPSNGFVRQSYAQKCFDEEGNPPEWFDRYDEEKGEIRIEIWDHPRNNE